MEGFLAFLVLAVLGLLVTYWIIRIAVEHALRSVLAPEHLADPPKRRVPWA